VRGSSALQRHPDQETRDRILEVATGLFAERGFRKVTVREICRGATANVAAVNYHFGDKLGLYREVLRTAIDAMKATTDEGRRAGEGHGPDERLRRFLRVYLHRALLHPGHTVTHKLISRELNDPSPVFNELVEKGMKPRIDYLSSLVAELIDCPVADPRVIKSVASIQSQTILYFPHVLSASFGLKHKLTASEVDRIAEHIAEFSLGGIQAVSKR
jgi:AcrR family transcriptional regulator